ncbi:MAG TPA: BTAD domain-containing putative transcriptional regulator [Micromonosporaceae bacterium]|nr:BTAD domain-containing putative transcriptional regulator [Micromonosporaceae bacterium]
MFFGILGTLKVQRTDGSEIAAGGAGTRSLLALLLLHAGRLVATDRLIDALYGPHPSANARNALQSRVSRLRRTLRDGLASDGLIKFHPAGYRLAVDPDQVDAHRFERLAREGSRALAAGEHHRAAAVLRSALDLWRGPALADVAAAPFAAPQAARLEELRMSMMETQAEARLLLGEQRELVAPLRELVAACPLRERARGLLMRALHAGGRQAEALAVYEEARQLLADELGADPSTELAAVHLAVLRNEPAPVIQAAAPVAVARPPAQLTSFIGRADELARIGKLLAATRLVTLTGPGGTGKTRLAIEASRRERFDVCFVDLAPVSDGGEVPQALLAALGIREAALLTPSPGQQPDPVTRLVAAFTDRPLLLVLDNCEHVIADVARLTHHLLAACPDLRVLATSREPLDITGESLCPVPQLPLPSPDATVEEVLLSPAIHLFVERAAAVRPDFRMDDGNREQVLRICRALDGLPLAIELAAARLRSLSVAEVAGRLDDRFRLLSRGSRTAPPRHRTLRAVVSWSWDLLSEAEQRLARRLTVFSGGATRATARRVCGLAEDEIDEGLESLTDKSLVQLDGGRYRMLETIREFCAGQLAEAGEEEPLRRAHAKYFLELALTADRYLRGAQQLTWLATLTAEHANLQAALRWAVRADPALAMRLVAGLAWYWSLRGLRSEASPLAAEVLERIGGQPLDGLDEEYVLCVSYAAANTAPIPDLDNHLDRAESIMTGLHRALRYPAAIVSWAVTAGPQRGDEAAHRKQIGDDRWSHAVSQFGLGFKHHLAGDASAAEAAFTAALAGFRAIGDRWGMANTLAELVELRTERQEALALISEASQLVGELGVLEDMADLLCRRAEVLLHGGDLDAASFDFTRAAELARRTGLPGKVAATWLGLADIARIHGDFREARRLYQLALSGADDGWYGDRFERPRVLIGLGRVTGAEGDVEAARSLLREALKLSTPADYPNYPMAAGAVEALAGVALLAGDPGRAAVLLGAGTALRGMPAAADPDVIAVRDGCRAHLGGAGYESAYGQGAALTREEALILAGA